MKHTPGPWKEIYGNKISIVGTMPLGDTDPIAVVYSANPESKEANAHLIASAPALIDLAERAYLKLLSLGSWKGRASEEGQRLLCDLRDTIAEVRGITDEEIQNEFESQAISKAEGRDER